jgi:uncharacterized membrane protein
MEGTAVGPIAITVGDVETASASLILTATSSNQALVPAAGLGVSGTGAARSLLVMPAAGQIGTTVITITVTDGDGGTRSDQFQLTVTARATMTTLSSPTASPTTYGAPVVLSATVTATSGTGTPTGSVEFFDGARSLGSAPLSGGVASVSTTAIGAGLPTIVTGVYTPTGAFATSIGTLARTVNKAAGTGTFLTLTPLQKQYSDLVLMEATVSPATASGTVTFQSGGVVLLSDVPIVGGKASANVPALVAIGTKVISAVFNTPNYAVANVTRSMTILREDARVTYVGSTATPLCLCGSATVKITVNVSDITAIDPVSDATAGDIGTATVSFVNRATLTTLATVNVTANIDRKTGTATYNFPASALSTAQSQTLTLGFVVSGNYTRNNAADNVTITITK